MLEISVRTLAARLAALKPLRAVYGNIDGQSLGCNIRRSLISKVEEVNVMMTHIGGYPGRYNPLIRKELYDTRLIFSLPDIRIS